MDFRLLGKRTLSVTLALVMAVSMLVLTPVMALADDDLFTADVGQVFPITPFDFEEDIFAPMQLTSRATKVGRTVVTPLQ